MITNQRKACADEDPELFYPVSYSTPVGKAQAENAKEVCSRCPFRDACREQALALEGNAEAERRYGIWGATTPAERRAIYDTRRKTALAA
ncbi:WhiB family transcriptional regulator [Kitasatospora sp. NPDC047058]|uniref:WhiB family transcriptional regulator n=1 Tax=Kitasatospora sp. NPDC047058 TaxID=3155620 RepID=UPI0033CC6FFF